MSNININGNTQPTNINPVQEDIKTERNEEENLFPSVEETSEILDVLFSGVVDAAFGNGTFTKTEAEIFVQGEKEIAKLVKEAPNKQSLVESIFDPDKAEREAREQYAADHPEYADVMQEGLKVQNEFDSKKEEERQNWIKENPAPEMFEKGGWLGVKITDEYKEWNQKQDNHLYEFEKNYTENNQNYANLKFEQNKSNSFLRFFFG